MSNSSSRKHQQVRPITDSQVRHAARSVGLAARRSRRRIGLENAGGYQLINLDTTFPYAGFRFDLTAEGAMAVIRGCKRPRQGARRTVPGSAAGPMRPSLGQDD